MQVFVFKTHLRFTALVTKTASNLICSQNFAGMKCYSLKLYLGILNIETASVRTKHGVLMTMSKVSVCFYLPCGLDSLPDTEVTDDPDDGQTQDHLPVDRSQLIQAVGQVKDLSPRRQTCFKMKLAAGQCLALGHEVYLTKAVSLAWFV